MSHSSTADRLASEVLERAAHAEASQPLSSIDEPREGQQHAGADASSDLTGPLLEHLQAPLANIKAAVHTLQASSRRAEAGTQEMLHLIGHEAEALNEALALAQELHALRGREALCLSQVELSDLLMTTLATWKPLAPSHSFELAMPGEVPPITGDLERLRRGLHCLIDAAVRLSPGGGTVRVDIRPHADEVVVSVRHHGATLHDEALPHFFEPFSHSATGPEAFAGGGLGLALGAAIVAAHGGRAWAESPASGPGTTAFVALPYVPKCLLTTRPSDVTPPPYAAPAPVSQPRAKPGVLILEGEVRMQRYLRANLDAQQYRPHVASDLADAERLIDLEDPDAILLDTRFTAGPLAETLRHLLEYAAAPIVVLAHAHDPIECARALDLGAADYLARPLSMDELLARLRGALRTRAALTHTQAHEPIFERDGLRIDFEQRSVEVNGKAVPLSKTEFKLLRVLAQHPTMVLSHEVLLERVWGPGYGNEVEFVWVYVRRLRRKIEPDPSHPRYILTVPGVGYRLG